MTIHLIQSINNDKLLGLNVTKKALCFFRYLINIHLFTSTYLGLIANSGK